MSHPKSFQSQHEKSSSVQKGTHFKVGDEVVTIDVDSNTVTSVTPVSPRNDFVGIQVL